MKKAIFALTSLLGAVAVCGISPAARAQNLLTNGSFETRSFSGWTTSGNFTNTSVQCAPLSSYSAQSGSCFAYFGPIGSDGVLSQTFNDTAGSILHVSGWLEGNGSSPSDWSLLVNGTSYVSVNPVPSQSWTQYSFTTTATGTDTFSIAFRNDPSYDAMDNFSVTQGTSTVPEPSTLALFGVGALGLLIALRRRRRTEG